MEINIRNLSCPFAILTATKCMLFISEPYQPEGYNPEAPAINPPRSGFWTGPRGLRPPSFHPQPPAPPSTRGRDLVMVQTVPESPPKKQGMC